MQTRGSERGKSKHAFYFIFSFHFFIFFASRFHRFLTFLRFLYYLRLLIFIVSVVESLRRSGHQIIDLSLMQGKYFFPDLNYSATWRFKTSKYHAFLFPFHLTLVSEFCGNALEVAALADEASSSSQSEQQQQQLLQKRKLMLALSTRAYNGFSDAQQKLLHEGTNSINFSYFFDALHHPY